MKVGRERRKTSWGNSSVDAHHDDGHGEHGGTSWRMIVTTVMIVMMMTMASMVQQIPHKSYTSMQSPYQTDKHTIECGSAPFRGGGPPGVLEKQGHGAGRHPIQPFDFADA
jgi:hypothetical protein